jgi:hypothetical protein
MYLIELNQHKSPPDKEILKSKEARQTVMVVIGETHRQFRNMRKEISE